MPEVVTNDLIFLSGEGVAAGSFGTTYTYDADPAATDLNAVVDGVTFTTPDGTPDDIIPTGSTTVIDGTEYTLTDVFSFWGEFTKTDPATGAPFTDSGQTLAITLTDATGNEINVVAPSDSFTGDPSQWSPGQITEIRVASEPFDAGAINADSPDASNKLSGDGDVEIPCFVVGSWIDTDKGPKPVEAIAVGDLILTRDNGYQMVRWTGRHAQTNASMAARPDLAAVIVRQGALGAGLPERDMRVSPWHRLLICGQRAEMLFGEYEVLVPAIHLVGQPGIERDTAPQTYIHLMFDEHQIIRADGAWSESFQPGVKTLAGMGEEQRAEIFALFPELAIKSGQDGYVAARLSLKEHEARALLAA
ncbi:MAG: Hint domain-containing protein [Rhodobacteraceae bacterium]|nr:Hint domain-containing protein [Paracoccaceae bacterium]